MCGPSYPNQAYSSQDYDYVTEFMTFLTLPRSRRYFFMLWYASRIYRNLGRGAVTVPPVLRHPPILHLALSNLSLRFSMAFLIPSRRFALTACKSAVTQRLPLASTSYIVARSSPVASIDRVSIRGYAKKSKKGKSRDDDDDATTTVIKTKGKASTKNGVTMAAGKKSKGDLVAGEEPIDLGDADAVEMHDEQLVSDLDEKMQKPVNWCRGVGFDGVERGSGRVSPGKHGPWCSIRLHMKLTQVLPSSRQQSWIPFELLFPTTRVLN